MYSFELPATLTKRNKLQTIVNTAVFRFYKFARNAKKGGFKVASFNKPFQLMITNSQDVPLFDTAWTEELSIFLKMQRTPAGVVKFAERVLIVIEELQTSVEVVADNLKDKAESIN